MGHKPMKMTPITFERGGPFLVERPFVPPPVPWILDYGWWIIGACLALGVVALKYFS